MKTHHAFFVVAVAALALGCDSKPAEPKAETNKELPPLSSKDADAKTEAPAPVGLKEMVQKDVKVGTGPAVGVGDLVNVTYTGHTKSFDGPVFDSSDKHDGTPFAFPIGGGYVIKGWDLGVVGMKKGGVRRLSIPAALGYGPKAQENIPANSDLFFEVKLWDFVKKGEEEIFDKTDLKVGSGAEAKSNSTVTISYVGKYVTEGPNNSFDKQQHKQFHLGKEEILPTLDKAIVGMKVGGVREVRLGPDLLRGAVGAGNAFSSNYIVRFDITLEEVH